MVLKQAMLFVCLCFDSLPYKRQGYKRHLPSSVGTTKKLAIAGILVILAESAKSLTKLQEMSVCTNTRVQCASRENYIINYAPLLGQTSGVDGDKEVYCTIVQSRAGRSCSSMHCIAPPSMYLHIYFVPSTLTPNITGKSKISLWDCLFLLIQCTQAYSFSTLFLHMINYHIYTNYKRPQDSYACPEQDNSIKKFSWKKFYNCAVLREKAKCVCTASHFQHYRPFFLLLPTPL